MKQGVGECNAKIILMGEHSVVYGHKAIALPFKGAQIKVIITQGDDEFISDLFTGSINKMPDASNHIQQLIFYLKQNLNRHELISIQVESNIPPSRGMGSSAAIANALIRAFFDFNELPLDDPTLFHYSMYAEKIAHGMPSGIDSLATASEHPVVFRKNHQPEYVRMNLPGYLVVGDCGVEGSTLEAVTDVRSLVEFADGMQHIEQLAILSNQFIEAMNERDIYLCGELMNHAQHHLAKLTVSHPSIDRMIQIATDSNALGTKLTGGGRGGCVISLVDNLSTAETIVRSWKESISPNVWLMKLDEGVS